MADLARFPRVRNLSLRDPLRDPETPLAQQPKASTVGLRALKALPGQFRETFGMNLSAAERGSALTSALNPATTIPNMINQAVASAPESVLEAASLGQSDLGMGEASLNEAGRVQRLTNPDGGGTIPNMLPNFVQAVGDNAGIRERAAGGTLASPAASPTDTPLELLPSHTQGATDNVLARSAVGTGPRVIRVPGENPLITNRDGSFASLSRGNAAEGGQAAADTLRSGIAKGNFQSISNADDISGGGLRSRVAGDGTSETSASPTIADLLSSTSDINLGGLQAAGALSTDLFNRREKGIRNRQKDRELGVQESTARTAGVTADASMAKALKGDEPNLTDKLRALGDVKIVSNPVSGTADLQVGNSLIPEALRPQWENFSANIRLTPEFIAEHGSKSPAEQDRIAARQAAEFMEEQGTISSGAPRSGIDALQTALGG